MSKPKHLFGDKVPTVKVAAKRYAATSQLDLTNEYPEVEAAFMQMIARVKAEAWDEGAEQGWDDCENGIEEMSNPYREGDE